MARAVLGKTPCPYCYYPINASGLMLRCTGLPAPGKQPCTVQEDPQRLQVLGDSTPVFPSFERPGGIAGLAGSHRARCPKCDGSSGTKVCPACHSVLPASFGAKSPMFGVVGVKGSGKTVMLTALTKELTSSIARRFDATITDVDSSALLRRLGTWGDDMERGGRLPDATPQYTRAQSVPAVLEWRYTRRRAGIEREQATILSFYDTSGEDLSTDDLARGLHYLSAADGLIVILDPFGFPENRAAALARGVHEDWVRRDPVKVMGSVTTAIREADRLKGTKKIKRPLAIVVSKVDAFYDQLPPDHPLRRPAPDAPFFDEAESLDLHHHVEAQIHEWGGDDLLVHLRHNYANYRMFAASALGTEPDYRAQRSNGMLPHRTAEPLLWLMADRNFLPKVG